MQNCKAVVLAAGKGTRMFSERDALPKVMRPARGKPMIHYVLQALDFLPPEDIVIVVGYRQETVRQALGESYTYAVQKEQRGTGHAVLCAEEQLAGTKGPVLICYGDMPLVRRDTYTHMIERHLREGNACTLLSGSLSGRPPYGRIIRDAEGRFVGVVEDVDCTPTQKDIEELNAGVYVMDAAQLLPALRELRPTNAQGELYLTDVPALFLQRGLKVGVHFSRVADEILGVNTLEQLAQVEEGLVNILSN